MKTLHLALILTLSLSVVFLITSQHAFADTCSARLTSYNAPQFYLLSDGVFAGTVQHIDSTTDHQWKVYFTVDKLWRGSMSQKPLMVMTNDLQGCGYSIVQGEKYLVYTNGYPPFFNMVWSKPYADAQSDIAIIDDPKFQSNEKTQEELNKKLVIARDAISNLMGSKMGDIPFNEVGVDEINSTLNVGIDSTKATLSEEQYLKKIKGIVGDIPIKITFGQIFTASNDLGDGNVFHMVAKDIALSGDIIEINGNLVTKDPIKIILSNPNGTVLVSTTTFADRDGYFTAQLKMPKDAIGGTWKIIGKSGNYQRELDVNVPVPDVTRTTNCCLISNYTGHVIIQSPLKQFKSGIVANDVKCNNGLSLIVKAEDGSPACVSPVTSTKLILMGWGESLKDATLPVKNIDIIGLQQNYTVGQPINVTINYTGYMSGGVYPNVEISDMNNSQVWSNCVPAHSETTMQFHYTATYNAQCGDAYPVINKTGTYTMVASLDNKTASAEFTIVKPLLLPASFEPCNTPYPNGTGIAVLYMPTNSTGKICVQYSNSNTPQSVNVRIFEAQRISQDTQDITATADHDTIPTGNSIVAYTLKTTNQAGFYGFTIFCVGTPLAVGYDNSSTIVQGDFPWLGQMFMCPAQFYDYHIVGLNNIGVKYIQ